MIPACGRGQRFRDAGYDKMKPLTNIYGLPMIEHVLKALKFEPALDEYVLVVNFDTEDLNHPIIRLEQTTLGAAETAFLAVQTLTCAEKDSSLLLVDCDAIYHVDVVSKFRALESEPGVRAAVLSFMENSADTEPKFSYVSTDNFGNAVEIAEKRRVGPFANTGAYWFASALEFLKAAESILQRKDFYLGEAYVSCVLNDFLRRRKVVRTLVIDEKEYTNVGTPECLEKYLQLQGQAFLFDLDGTLVDTTRAYVCAWDSLLAARGAYVDENFFETNICGLSDAQVEERFGIHVSSEEKDKQFVQNLDKVKEIPGAIGFVRKCQQVGMVHIVTNSNKAAAEALLKHFELSDVPLITATDVEFGKPNPELYRKAMISLGVSPTNCVIFEDSKCGATSARASGAKFVVAISHNLDACDAFYKNFEGLEPNQVLQHVESVAHLTDELTAMFGQLSTVLPVRASGGYISEILSASSGARKLVLKQENADHGVLQEVSENLGLHHTECEFYLNFAATAPICTPRFYGILPKSQALVLEDLSMLQRAPPFTLSSGLKVVHAIANMHSHFRGANLGKLSSHSTYMGHYVCSNYPAFKRKWNTTLPVEVINMFDHAVLHYREAESYLLKKPCTLLHGDLKFPNLFWDQKVNAGEPIFIDWQYAGPGQGIEDIIFMLVESCANGDFEQLASPLINAYYAERERHDGVNVSTNERDAQVSCALAGFPLFVALWFGCIDASKLSEPNFPFLYILRLANAFKHLYKPHCWKS